MSDQFDHGLLSGFEPDGTTSIHLADDEFQALLNGSADKETNSELASHLQACELCSYIYRDLVKQRALEREEAVRGALTTENQTHQKVNRSKPLWINSMLSGLVGAAIAIVTLLSSRPEAMFSMSSDVVAPQMIATRLDDLLATSEGMMVGYQSGLNASKDLNRTNGTKPNDIAMNSPRVSQPRVSNRDERLARDPNPQLTERSPYQIAAQNPLNSAVAGANEDFFVSGQEAHDVLGIEQGDYKLKVKILSGSATKLAPDSLSVTWEQNPDDLPLKWELIAQLNQQNAKPISVIVKPSRSTVVSAKLPFQPRQDEIVDVTWRLRRIDSVKASPDQTFIGTSLAQRCFIASKRGDLEARKELSKARDNLEKFEILTKHGYLDDATSLDFSQYKRVIQDYAQALIGVKRKLLGS